MVARRSTFGSISQMILLLTPSLLKILQSCCRSGCATSGSARTTSAQLHVQSSCKLMPPCRSGYPNGKRNLRTRTSAHKEQALLIDHVTPMQWPTAWMPLNLASNNCAQADVSHTLTASHTDVIRLMPQL